MFVFVRAGAGLTDASELAVDRRADVDAGATEAASGGSGTYSSQVHLGFKRVLQTSMNNKIIFRPPSTPFSFGAAIRKSDFFPSSGGIAAKRSSRSFVMPLVH